MFKTFVFLFSLQMAFHGLVSATPTSTAPESGNDSVQTKQEGVAGYSHQQAMNYGEKMYREGILPDGSIMQAYVQGDIPADGDIFTCALCHRRSGLGTSEGYIVALPVNGENLYRPRVFWDPRRRHSRPGSTTSHQRHVPDEILNKELRPAYNDRTLARAIRHGADASDRVLDFIMPRYDLSDKDMSILIYYLKNLSTDLSPGVNETSIRFATVITDDVSQRDRDAMLNVLKAVVKDRNSQTRNQAERAKRGAFVRRELDSSYRYIELDIWELKGPKENWRNQLEEYYQQNEVFALLGGISDSDWTPVHEFAEAHHLPVALPVTDQPVVSDGDWYSLYFSKGVYQEGEAAARFVQRTPVYNNASVVQLIQNNDKAENLADGVNDRFGQLKPVSFKLSKQNKLPEKFFNSVKNDVRPVVFFWGDNDALKQSGLLDNEKLKGVDIFLSSTLLNKDFSAISEANKARIYITQPYSPVEDKKRHILSQKTWLKIRKVPETNFEIQAKMYFLGWMLSDIFKMMKNEFYRDYFLETFEMMKDQTHAIALYPRLSFGPDQRYISKGCYIVQLDKGDETRFIKRSDWVIH